MYYPDHFYGLFVGFNHVYSFFGNINFSDKTKKLTVFRRRGC